MKLKWSLPFFIILLIVSVAGLTISPIIFAQNNMNKNLTDNASTKSSNGSGGGMSTNSVDIAKSNSKDLSVNSTSTGNNSTSSNASGGGMSTNSVDIAKSNSKDLSVNSTSTGNNSTSSNASGGGMSTNSVEKAKESS